MLVNLLWFALWLAVLIAAAELLVRGASALASSFGVSPLVIGLTVVSMGTSAPEVAVSVGAALDGRAGLAIGNAVGSNVVNVLLILGLAAVISPLAVNAQLIRQEVPVMIGASLLLLVLMLDGSLARGEGAFLLALLLAYTVFVVRQSRRQTQATQAEFAHEVDRRAGIAAGRPAWRSHWAVQCAFVGAGLGALYFGAGGLVQAAVALAAAFGVSDLVIGLTIVAVGTSVPEIAASTVAAIRGERDIAVGNVVGSCIFNILGCLGLAAAVVPPGLAVPAAVMYFDVWVMLAAAVACLPIFVSGRQIARWEGGLFLFYYVAYVAYLVLAAREHALLPAFSGAMLSFVIPLTLVTLVITLLRPALRPRP